MINHELEIPISKKNDAIVKNSQKCISCGYCKKVCQNDVIVSKDYKIIPGKESLCLNCGLCANACPTESIHERLHYHKVKNLLHSKKNKIIVFNLSPIVGITLKETFPEIDELDITNRVITALKKLGAKYVFNTSFSTDIMIMETSQELVNRLNKKHKMPLFTSFCPAWIKYCEIFYPELLNNVSKTKSPNIIGSNLVKTYFANSLKIDPKKIVNIVVSPCVARKSETNRQELNMTNKDTDYVLTIRELSLLLKEENINLDKLKPSSFDIPFSNGSNSAIITEASGGLGEAILRTTNYLLTSKNIPKKDVDFLSLRGTNGFKEATISIANREVKVAVCNGIKSAVNLIDKLKKKEVSYDLVEVMCCPGGCIAGGGTPKTTILNNVEIKNQRLDNLYELANENEYLFSYRNKEMLSIYKDTNQKLLHTKYVDKSYLLGGHNE